MDGRDLDRGVAGASGRREYARRRARREDRTRRRHPLIGSLLLKFQRPPRHERAWALGAAGEEALAAFLDRRCLDAIVLHDRRMPRGYGNIDHLAIAPSGVHVIDAKRYKGKIKVHKPLFFGEAKLLIGRRDQTKLVGQLARQVKAVRSAIESSGLQVPVQACFCFINPEGQSGGAGLPLLRTLSIKGYPLFYPRRLARRLKRPGELGPEQVRLVAEALAQRFPAA